MPETFTAQRQALGDAYLGDTKAAKALFTDPKTFDQRVISLLSGLGQGVDSPLPSAITTEYIAAVMRALDSTLPSAISGQDIREVLATLDSTDNANRVALLQKILASVTSQAITYYDDTVNLNSSAFVARFNFETTGFVYNGFSDASADAIRFQLVRFSPYFARLYIHATYPSSQLPPAVASARLLRSVSVCLRSDLIPALPAQIVSFVNSCISDFAGLLPVPAELRLFGGSNLSGEPYFGNVPYPLLSSYRRTSHPSDPAAPQDHISFVFCGYTFEGVFVPANATPFANNSSVRISVATDLITTTPVY